jgi:hypothetical protein
MMGVGVSWAFCQRTAGLHLHLVKNLKSDLCFEFPKVKGGPNGSEVEVEQFLSQVSNLKEEPIDRYGIFQTIGPIII